MPKHSPLRLDALMVDMMHIAGEDDHPSMTSSNRYRDVVESAAVGIAECALDGRFNYVNDRYVDMVGYSRPELLKMTCQDLTHPKDLSVTDPYIRKLLQGAPKVSFDKRYVRKDGTTLWCSIHLSVRRGPVGEPLGVVSVVTDVTDRKGSEIQSRELMERAEEETRKKSDVLACVSHDLKNPLTAIQMHSELISRLSGNSSPAVIERSASAIARASKRMKRLVSDLMDADSLHNGRFTVVRRWEPARDVLAEAAESLEPIARASGITFEWADRSLGAVLSCDRERIVQVLINIGENALKHSERGDTVLMSASKLTSEVEFYVRDNGKGISADELPRIFDRLWRGESSTAEGSGLGLFISKGIVDAHGGKIWAESQPGLGSVFKFRLPTAA